MSIITPFKSPFKFSQKNTAQWIIKSSPKYLTVNEQILISDGVIAIHSRYITNVNTDAACGLNNSMHLTKDLEVFQRDAKPLNRTNDDFISLHSKGSATVGLGVKVSGHDVHIQLPVFQQLHKFNLDYYTEAPSSPIYMFDTNGLVGLIMPIIRQN